MLKNLKFKIPVLVIFASVFLFNSYISINSINNCNSGSISLSITKSYAYAGSGDSATCDSGGPGSGTGDGNGDGVINSLDCPSGLVYIAAGGYCSSCLPNSYYDTTAQACFFNAVVVPVYPAPIVHIWFTE